MDSDNNDQQTDMSASDSRSQATLFPEDDHAGTTPAVLSNQLASMSPDDLAMLAQTLDPDVRSVLANALFAAMKPEDQEQADTTPGADVADQMKDATPERPEQQYQMSCVRSHRRLEATDGMGALANDHLDRMNNRVTNLQEHGMLTKERADHLHKQFDKQGENRFSILLDGGGLLRDSVVEVEALERALSGMATLDKDILEKRFSGSRPRFPGKTKEDANTDLAFDKKAAEDAGSRLARL